MGYYLPNTNPSSRSVQEQEDAMSKHERWGSLCHFCEESWPCETVTLRDENARLREQAEALADALRNQGLLQNSPNGVIWHVHDCTASFDFAECNYRCRVAREAMIDLDHGAADRATDEGRASE